MVHEGQINSEIAVQVCSNKHQMQHSAKLFMHFSDISKFNLGTNYSNNYLVKNSINCCIVMHLIMAF